MGRAARAKTKRKGIYIIPSQDILSTRPKVQFEIY